MTLRHRGVNAQGAPGLVAQGPLVKVILGPHPEDARATQEAGGTIRTTTGHLLVDTGAQLTVVENTVAVALGLVPIRYARITGVSGQSDECPVYRMGVVIGMAEDGTSSPHEATFVADVAGVPSPPVKLTHLGFSVAISSATLACCTTGPKGSST